MRATVIGGHAALLAAIAILVVGATAGTVMAEPHLFLRERIGLTSQEIAAIDQGQVVAKVLPSPSAAEIYVFGAVFVKGKPRDYVKLAFDADRLRRVPGYLGIGRMSDPPRMSDLEGFTLEPGDIRDLKRCKPGKCAVQLPAEAMKDLHHAVDWESADAAAQVNEHTRATVLALLMRYQNEGNRALGIYRDKDKPFDVDAHLRLLLGQAEAMPAYLPLLSEYLLEYPRTTLPAVDSFFFWEKVDFGLKPTLRLNHAILYRAHGPRASGEIIIAKQLYASHYFQLALDLTACVPGRSEAGETGFYLISLKGSTQHGLTGLFGSIFRTIVVSRTRAAQEKILLNIKTTLEAKRQ